MQQPSDEHEPQTVIQEVQKGYMFGGRALRPSGVVVAVAPQDAPQPPTNGES
jgi:molecular chaperone GrpE